MRRRYEEVGALAVLAVCLATLAYPRLAPGICFDDPGDLQTACAVLGIAHPPGYAGYASLGRLLTWIPGLEPARAVTLACLAAGVGALLLCAAVQIRLGVNPWLAAAACLPLAWHPRVWVNLVVPEVYAPTWLFTTAAVYLLASHFTREPRPRGRLPLAFLLLGFAVANRPPTLLFLPGVLLGLLLTRRKGRRTAGETARAVLLCVAGFALPVCYCAGFLWIRDTARQPYNYIEARRCADPSLPAADGGAAAKIGRIWWLVSGREYAAERAGAFHLLDRLRWIGEAAAAGDDALFATAIVALVVGGVAARRRSMSTLIVLLGVLLGAIVYLCVYRTYGTAADMLPLLGAVCIFAGTALGLLLPGEGGRWRRALAMLLFALTVVETGRRVRNVPDCTAEYDATAYLRSVDFAALPTDALVLTDWRKNAALHYALLTQTKRTDISVLYLSPERWPEYARRYAGQGGSVYLSGPISAPVGAVLESAGGLWRLEF